MAASMWSALEGDPTSILNNQLASALSTMGDAQYWEESISPSTIRTSLNEADPSNPSHTPSLLRGMKWLLASISKGRDVSDFYSSVVKLVGANSLEVRKMVYMYLVQYADYDATTRELSLLSINSFQRGLSDAEQLIRGLALRVLTSIRIPDILQIQILGVQRCLRDKSPYVRKCAAGALAKLSPRSDDEQQAMLVEFVKELLAEEDSTMVLSSALIALNELAADRLDLLHTSFRKICHLLTDMDEWGQVIVLEMLARYCRRYFREPAAWRCGTAERIDSERRVRRTTMGIMREEPPPGAATVSLAQAASDAGVELPPRKSPSPRKIKRRVVKKGFYSDESDTSTEEEVYADELTGDALPLSTALRERNILGLPGVPVTITVGGSDEDSDLSEDHRLLLHSAMPLLKSRNAGVVLAVCCLQYYCGISSVKVRSDMGKALVRIHRDRREIQYVVLCSIRTLAKECPSAFAPFLHDFFISAMDAPFTRLIKLDILTSLALEPAAIEAVLGELRNYIRHSDKTFARAAIRAVGRVAEMARIVYDRHGSKTGHAVKERAAANRIALNCLYGLVTLTQASDKSAIVGESVLVMQWILQLLLSDAADHGDLMSVEDANQVQNRALRRMLLLLVHTLSKRLPKPEPEDEEEEAEPTRLDKLTVKLPPAATASALWTLGEFLAPQPTGPTSVFKLDQAMRSRVRLEIVRLVARCFADLSPVEKEQGVHFATKMLVSKGSGVAAAAEETAICELVLAMGRLDVNPDVRDRARFESALVRATIGLQHDLDSLEDLRSMPRSLSLLDAQRMLLRAKPAPSSLPLEDNHRTDSDESDGFRFGTLSSLVGHRARSAYVALPAWAEKDSPNSLRDPPKKETKTVGRGESSGAQRPRSRGFYEGDSSPSDDESSSSSESSSEESDESGSSDESSSSSASSSSSSASGGDLLQLGQPQRPPGAPAGQPNGPGIPSRSNVRVETVSSGESSSSSDDESSASSSSSIDVECNVGAAAPAVANLIPMGGTAPSNAPSRATTSFSDDFRGMTLAPVATDAAVEPTIPDFERDSSAWMTLVRAEHAGGLSVEGRYLRGITKAREVQLVDLADKPNVVCLQVRFTNQKADGAPFRRLKVLQRSSTSSSSIIGPKRIVAPAELDQLAAGQKVDVSVAIEFANVSDRDGSLQAKLDIKFGSGGVPVEIKPKLGDVLLPCKLTTEAFNAALRRLQGFQRVESSFSLDPSARDSLPSTLLRHVALSPVGKLAWKSDLLRLAGTLPASMDPVYVQVKCTSSGQGSVVVCCDHALAVNSILNQVKWAATN